MAHVERTELFGWLEAEGFQPVSHERLQALIKGRRAR
jgi:hypothetical protein